MTLHYHTSKLYTKELVQKQAALDRSIKHPLITRYQEHCRKLTPMIYSWVSATTEENSTSTAWGSSEMMAAAILSIRSCSSELSDGSGSGSWTAEQPPETTHTWLASFEGFVLYIQHTHIYLLFMLPFDRRWRLSVPCSANPRPHLEHLKGFSPVWWRMWRTKAPFSRNAREQCVHTYGLSSPCVRWCTWSAFWNEKRTVWTKTFTLCFYTNPYLHLKHYCSLILT